MTSFVPCHAFHAPQHAAASPFGPLNHSNDFFRPSCRSNYIRHLSYCFYIAVNRICIAISRGDGALKPWSAVHLGVGNSKQKPADLDLPVQVM